MRIAGVFIALAILAAMAVFGLQTALAGAGTKETIDSESFTPNAGTVQTLDRSKLDHTYYNETVQVVDENGDRSFEGDDYEWFDRNGTIKPLTGGNLDGDSSATITYSYRQTSQQQRQLTALLANIPQGLALILPLGFVLAGIAALRGL